MEDYSGFSSNCFMTAFCISDIVVDQYSFNLIDPIPSYHNTKRWNESRLYGWTRPTLQVEQVGTGKRNTNIVNIHPYPHCIHIFFCFVSPIFSPSSPQQRKVRGKRRRRGEKKFFFFLMLGRWLTKGWCIIRVRHTAPGVPGWSLTPVLTRPTSA